jgi:hypothetical protein
MATPSVVLLTDKGPDSKVARSLLEQAGISFSEVSTDTPGREGRPAPQLYTSGEGRVPHLGGIRAWVSRYREKRDGSC